MRINSKLAATFAMAALVVAGPIGATTATLIENGNFENGNSTPWETPGWWAEGAGTSGVDSEGRFCTTITKLGHSEWGAQLRQSEISFIKGETYKVSFNAWASAPSKISVGAMDETVNPIVSIFDSANQDDVIISTGLSDTTGQAINFEFVAQEDTQKARFRFMLGAGLVPEGETLCLDNIVVQPPAKNILTNSTFDNVTNNVPDGWEIPAWWDGGAGSSEVDSGGRMCTTVTTEGGNDWGAQFRQVGKTLIAGRTYTVNFDAWSSVDMATKYDVIDEAAGYVILLGTTTENITARLEDAAQHFSAEYEVTTDSSGANFRFLFGAGLVPAGETICLDNVELLDTEGNSAIQPEEPAIAAVHANQHGYFPTLAKFATYKVVSEESADSRIWNLLDADGDIVATGNTVSIEGVDSNSGDVIHHIDFTEFDTEGTDYVLQVMEGEEAINSFPFDISNTLMDVIKYQALSYFYHNRSGIEILEEVVGDEKWARPAGHLDDNSVETFACKDDPQSELCRSNVDVSGGWYDAGDHGKYVVNGGISVWTMLNQYERSKYLGTNSADFGAGKLTLPAEEMANNMPDILDEAKWQMEFMLKMQIPSGQAFAGMAYHKMHDDGWTGLGLAPHEDENVRYIHAPTTAATLNLAANAAQCYRVYKEFDTDFAERCLVAATTAYQAALANPQMYAGKPATDNANFDLFSMTEDNGGGLYGENENSDESIWGIDEFYWASAELYISTKHQKYLTTLQSSPLYGKYNFADTGAGNAFPTALFSWGDTNMLGVMSAATMGDALHLDAVFVAQSKNMLVAAADNFVEFANVPGYSLPLDSSVLYWGSNSSLVNNMMVLGLANDITGQQNNLYVDAMANGMSYLMGNNPMGFSYITGYGENALQNPHHRFWANASNANYPVPPPGVMSGGPNSTHLDPVSLAKVAADCPAETCFIDDIGSWSTNEITINWNSPFAWVTAYLDEQGDLASKTGVICTYTTTSQWNTGFIAEISISNNSANTINGWDVNWQYSDGSTVSHTWNAVVSGTAPYSASNLSWNSTIASGQTISFGFIGQKGSNNAETPVVLSELCD